MCLNPCMELKTLIISKRLKRSWLASRKSSPSKSGNGRFLKTCVGWKKVEPPMVMGRLNTSIAFSIFPFATSTLAGEMSALYNVMFLPICSRVLADRAVTVAITVTMTMPLAGTFTIPNPCYNNTSNSLARLLTRS